MANKKSLANEIRFFVTITPIYLVTGFQIMHACIKMYCRYQESAAITNTLVKLGTKLYLYHLTFTVKPTYYSFFS